MTYNRISKSIKGKCLTCGKEFYYAKWPSTPDRKYCSRKCAGTPFHNSCPNCGKPLFKTKKYCSRKCYHEYIKVRFNESFFEKIDTSIKAYWLGYIMGDGTVFCNKQGKRCKLIFECQKRDRDIIEKFATHIKVDNKQIVERPEHESVSLSLYSSKLVNNLFNTGIPKKNKSKKSYIIKFDDELKQNAFLCGLFTADGGLSGLKGRAITLSLTAGNNKIIKDWISFFSDWHFEKRNGFKKNGENKKWWTATKYIKREDKETFNYYFNFFYNQNLPSLERKYQRLKNWWN
jgi:hypothetical protein